MTRSLADLRTTYYALGGGLGHGVRTLALDRAWRRLTNGPRRWLVNSPFAATLARLATDDPRGDPPTIVPLSPTASPAEATDWIARELATEPPDLLIVDAFPRGLAGELLKPLADRSLASSSPGVSRPKSVLIARTLPHEYVERYHALEAACELFDVVLAPGESSPFVERLAARRPIVRTPACLLRDAEELPSREEAARRLGVDPARGATLVVGTGTRDECDEAIAIARYLFRTDRADEYRVRLVLPDDVAIPDAFDSDDATREPSEAGRIVRVAPLLDVLPAAAAIVGSAGYHLAHEARALGIAACWRARRRKYDDQASRAAAGDPAREGTFETPADALRWLRERRGSLRPPDERPHYVNGATAAAAALAALF